ncbi:MAG: hypothetical protein HRU17_01355 [Polyangiaceae bacterium]|nr:hypothetical protein [Polyangiaceae bacterium]
MAFVLSSVQDGGMENELLTTDNTHLWLMAIVIAALGAALFSRLSILMLRHRIQLRGLRAQRGEIEAVKMLKNEGYRILATQPEQAWPVVCDGESQSVRLRVDLIVSRDNKRYAADVKTGAIAPRLQTAATRRQLLEYSLAYDVDGVLLVDMEKREVREIEFPGAQRCDHASVERLVWMSASCFLCCAYWL